MLDIVDVPIAAVATLLASKQAALQPIKVCLDRLVFVPEMVAQ